MNKLVVANIDARRLRKLISENHYSHGCTQVMAGYGVWWMGRLSGGIVFSVGAGRYPNAYCTICKPSEVAELTRLWLADEVPKNSESKVIAISLRALKHGSGRFKAVLSYADAAMGHIGTIYQASNWYYMGQQRTSSARVNIGGRLYHTYAVRDRFGTSNAEKLCQVLGRDDIKMEKGLLRKHAYIYPLDDTLRPWLEAHKKPYPKRQPAEDAAHSSIAGRCKPDPAAPVFSRAD